MKKAVARVLVCGVCMVGVFLPARAVDTNGRVPPPFAARVRVLVQEEHGLAPEVYRHVKREVKNLPGVTVVTSRADWIISAVAQESASVPGCTGQVTLSFVVLEVWRATTIAGMTLRMELLPEIMSDPGIVEPRADALLEVAKMGCLKQHNVWTGRRADLGVLCKRAVAAFDTGPLAEARAIHQRIRQRELNR